MHFNNLVELSEKHPLLALLSPEGFRKLIDTSFVMPRKAERYILREGEPAANVYFLLHGALRVFHRHHDGREVLLILFKPPALFGEMEAIVGRTYLEHVITMEPSTLLVTPAEVFVQLLQTESRFSWAVMTDLAARFCIACDQQRSLAFGLLETRLIRLLVSYCGFYGEKRLDGIYLKIGLTQESLARDLGATRKALGQTLRDLRSRGLVLKRDGCYVVQDLASLETMVSAENLVTASALPVTYRMPRETRSKAPRG